MSETYQTTCDGCGGTIDDRRAHMLVQIGPLFAPRRLGGPDWEQWATNQHLHGISCLVLWISKLPEEVRDQMHCPQAVVDKVRAFASGRIHILEPPEEKVFRR